MDTVNTASCVIGLLQLFLFVLVFSENSVATDSITRSRGISVGQTLISSGKTFELGFFTPGDSTRLYVGIWYKNISAQKVVWVANRDKPLSVNDTAANLTIGEDGNLILLDGMKSTLWSTNISSQPSRTFAVLSDKGDLTLYNSESRSTLWQSFSYPGDTFITGMSIGVSNATGVRSSLSSWKTENDPTTGIFVCGLTQETPPQVVIWKSSEPYWRSGPWDGWKFTGTSFGSYNGFVLTQDNQQGSVYLNLNQPTLSKNSIFSLAPDGVLKMSSWDIVTQQGGVSWESIDTPCDVYGACGPFGFCDKHVSRKCKCLKGFAPKSTEEWEKGIWISGCVRRTELLCATNISVASNNFKNDEFLKLSSMKPPDHYSFFSKVNIYGCRLLCSTNCSCMAYAAVGGIGCLIWIGDLIDTQQFSSIGTDLYLRLASSELSESKYNKKLIIAITTSCGVILFFFVLFFFLLKAKRKENRRRIFKEFGSGSSDLPMIEFDKLASACSNFSEVNKLGSGGFGPVYKGKLDDGIEIAVKRLSSHSGQGAVEFKNEILLISKLQHRNLVKLLGYCIKKDEKLLIYEYLKNKSLDLFLFDKKSGLQLDWDRRFKIILGIARGLLYLHTDSRLRIIHRDLKAGNILLDDNMDPKISDFGLARAFHITEELANTNRVVGTFGYMSPEYAIEGRFSEKSDVFSFGILLLEIISGRKNTSRYCGDEYNLLGYAWHLWKEERGLELVDKALGSSYSTEQFMQCMHIGLLCTQDQTADRPTMSNTVLMLTSEMDLPKPKPPRFYQILLGLDLRTNSKSRFTANDVSLSLVEGR